MLTLILLILFIFVQISEGARFNCYNGSNCDSCPTAPGDCSWSLTNGVCSISDCSCNAGSTKWNENYCDSCFNNNVNGFQNACVNSDDYCLAGRSGRPWTQHDCTACFSSTYVLIANPNSCKDCSAASGLTDTVCAACATLNSNSNTYANSAQTLCVNSSATCDASRTASWNMSDCKLCQGSQYVLVGSTCEACSSLTSTSDETCGYCATLNSQSTKYADVAGTKCVSATSSCGGSRTSKWTQSDCQTCYSSNYAYIPTKNSCLNCSSLPGSNLTDEICGACATSLNNNLKFANAAGTSCVNTQFTCNSSRSPPWNQSDCQTCYSSSYNLISSINKCLNCSSLPSSNLSDDICGACATINSNSNKFSNADGTQCVNSQLTCSSLRSSPWNQSDCQTCYSSSYNFYSSINKCLNCSSLPSSNLSDDICGTCATVNSNSNKFANAAGNQCVNSQYTCNNSSRTFSWNQSDCQTCFSSSYTFITSLKQCLNCSSLPSSNLSDDICGTCATMNSNSNKFANAAGNQCVNSQYTCNNSSRKSSWNQSDCQTCFSSSYSLISALNQCLNCSSLPSSNLSDDICGTCATQNNNNKKFANSSKTQCINSQDTCNISRASLWSLTDCQLCYSTDYIYISSLKSCQNCQILPATNLTDDICGSCSTKNNNSNKFANTNGTNCVNSQSTCTSRTSSSPWSQSDCQTCNNNNFVFIQSTNTCQNCQSSSLSKDTCVACQQAKISTNSAECQNETVQKTQSEIMINSILLLVVQLVLYV